MQGHTKWDVRTNYMRFPQWNGYFLESAARCTLRSKNCGSVDMVDVGGMALILEVGPRLVLYIQGKITYML